MSKSKINKEDSFESQIQSQASQREELAVSFVIELPVAMGMNPKILYDISRDHTS